MIFQVWHGKRKEKDGDLPDDDSLQITTGTARSRIRYPATTLPEQS